MSKKFLFIMLAAALAGAVLTGCGRNGEPAGKPNKPAETPKKTEVKVKSGVAAPQKPEALYSADGKTLLKYNGTGTEFTVRDGVTTIGDGAFAGCETLETVKLPDSLVTIGSRSFAECRNLNSVNFPAGVVAIGSGAFQDCNLKSVAIPAATTSIGEKAFSGCGIEKAEPPPSREAAIGQGAFGGCPCEAYVKERCPSYKR